MDDCCQEKEHELAALQTTHGRVLKIVLAINAVFFLRLPEPKKVPVSCTIANGT